LKMHNAYIFLEEGEYSLAPKLPTIITGINMCIVSLLRMGALNRNESLRLRRIKCSAYYHPPTIDHRELVGLSREG